MLLQHQSVRRCKHKTNTLKKKKKKTNTKTNANVKLQNRNRLVQYFETITKVENTKLH